jgi:hypothetical protein
MNPSFLRYAKMSNSVVAFSAINTDIPTPIYCYEWIWDLDLGFGLRLEDEFTVTSRVLKLMMMMR